MKVIDITHFLWRKSNSHLFQVFYNKEFLSLSLKILKFFLKIGLKNTFQTLLKMFPLELSKHYQKDAYHKSKFGFPVFFHFTCLGSLFRNPLTIKRAPLIIKKYMLKSEALSLDSSCIKILSNGFTLKVNRDWMPYYWYLYASGVEFSFVCKNKTVRMY